MSYRVEKHGEVIPLNKRTNISTRYKAVTKAINREFWNSQSDSAHSFYVGSYGRGTAIDTSDVDILVELPEDEYNRLTFLLNYLKMNTIAITSTRKMGSPDYCKL